MTEAHSPRAPLDARIPKGVEAHARRDHFTAHEHFEDAWRASGAPRSLELHALAQLEAALHKLTSHRKPEAARAIMQRAREKLGRVETSSHGIDLDGLRSSIDAWLSATKGETFAAYPPIELRVCCTASP